MGRSVVTRARRADAVGLPGRGEREGERADLAVVAEPLFGLGQGAQGALAALDHRFGPDELLHRQLGRDPVPRRRAPAVADVHAHGQAEPSGLGHGVAEQLPPVGSQRVGRRLSWGLRPALADREHQDIADARVPHGLEVGGDSLTGHVAAGPVPVDPGPRVGRRLGEGAGQVRQVSGDGRRGLSRPGAHGNRQHRPAGAGGKGLEHAPARKPRIGKGHGALPAHGIVGPAVRPAASAELRHFTMWICFATRGLFR